MDLFLQVSDHRGMGILAALIVAHYVGDFWLQTDRMATRKTLPGWMGRGWCALHVAVYTATVGVVMVAAGWRAGAVLDPGMVLLALTLVAVSHYAADRRGPLLRLAAATGSGSYAATPAGVMHLDQAWHLAWLLVAAMVVGG